MYPPSAYPKAIPILHSNVKYDPKAPRILSSEISVTKIGITRNIPAPENPAKSRAIKTCHTDNAITFNIQLIKSGNAQKYKLRLRPNLSAINPKMIVPIDPPAQNSAPALPASSIDIEPNGNGDLSDNKTGRIGDAHAILIPYPSAKRFAAMKFF